MGLTCVYEKLFNTNKVTNINQCGFRKRFVFIILFHLILFKLDSFRHSLMHIVVIAESNTNFDIGHINNSGLYKFRPSINFAGDIPEHKICKLQVSDALPKGVVCF